MESDSDSSGEDTSVERSTILPTELEPKDPYLIRPLPTMIGSATFYETDHLGLRLEESSDSEYGSEVSDSEGESTEGTETEVRMRKKPADRKTAGGLAEYSGGSSGDLFSEDDATAVKENPVKQENGTSLIEEPISKKMKGKFTNGNSSDGGLFGSSSEGEDLFSEEPKKAKKVVKQTERQVSEETIEPVSTPAPASKKKKTKKRPAGAVPVFDILDSDSDDDSEELTRSENRAPSSRSAVSATSSKVKVDHGLFGGDSDSGEDLFSPEVPKEKKKEIPKQKDTQPKEPANNVSTLFGGGESNFDVSDSDEDLFEASTSSKKTEERTSVKKPIGGVQLFSGINQAALLGNLTSQGSDREKTNSPITVANKKETKQLAISLYDDSSPEDDLFSSSSKLTDKSNSVKTEQKIKTETDVPIPAKSAISNGLNMFNSSGDESGDDLFSSSVSSKKITASEVKQPVVVKPDSPLPVNNSTEDKQDHNTHNSLGREPVNTPDLKTKTTKPPGGLFQQLDSDSDEDDLFSILGPKTNTNKYPPPESKSTLPESKSTPPVSESKPPLSEPTAPVFESKPPVSTPTAPVSKPTALVSNEGGDLFSENDDLFFTIPSTPEASLAPTTTDPPPSNKPRTAPSLFSAIDLDDQDDEGLFDSPASLDLFVIPSLQTTLPSAAKPKPAKTKTTLPTLFDPIDIDTNEGGLFDQTSPIKKTLPPVRQDTLDLPPQPTSVLPSLTSSRPKNPGRRPPSQKTRQARAEKSTYEDLIAPSTAPEPVEDVVQSVQRPAKKLSGAVGNLDFLKELNRTVGKGLAPGGSPTKRKPAPKTEVLFEDEGDLFSKPAPHKERVQGAEMGASPLDGFYTAEEPSKLLGVAKGRPRAPGKRLPTRNSRTNNIPTPSEDLSNFFTDPSETPTPVQTGDMLFNGDLGNNLFTLPKSGGGGNKNAFEEDTLFSGGSDKTSKQVNNSRNDDLFAKPTNMTTRAKPEDNSAISGADKKHITNPLELPEDLFASVALPKATKTSKPVNKERHTASPVVPQVSEPVISQPLGNNHEGAEELPAREDKSKKFKVVKRTDDELFGGEDDLFGALPESKTRSDKSKKKKATDASKKPKKPKKEIDPATMDLFD